MTLSRSRMLNRNKKKNDPNAEFAYIGTEKGIEKRLVEKEGYEFHSIKIQGVKRSLSLSNLKTAYLVMTAPSKAKKIIEKFKPDVVIGTGGYVSWAPLRAAADTVKEKDALTVCVFASSVGGKVSFVAGCGKEAVAKGAHAGMILKAISPICGGGGGGRPDNATSGGKDASKIADAIAAINDVLASQIK